MTYLSIGWGGKKGEMSEVRERFDTRCIVHSGSWFPDSMRGARCFGTMLEMPSFWASHADGDLTGYICDRHADFFLDMETTKSVRQCYLRDQIERIRMKNRGNP